MKLRFRSLETRETLRIEVPVPCYLPQLKMILSRTLSSCAPAPPDSIHLSLNRKDEIQSCSPDDETLQALGIASGDLIFFTIGPNGFSCETLVPNSNSQSSVSKGIVISMDPKLQAQSQTLQNPMNSLAEHIDQPGSSGLNKQSDQSLDSQPSISKETAVSMGAKLQAQSQTQQNPMNSQAEHIDQPGSGGLNEQSDESSDEMEIDALDEDNDDECALDGVGKSFSAPGFLRKVFTEELGGSDNGGRNKKLLVIAVHAVLLESGFVGFDMNLKTEISRFQFQVDWPSNLSVFYTFPGIIGNVLPSSEYHNGVVILKFQNIGTCINVYGSLKNGAIHSVRLKEDELVSFLNVAWANCGLREEITRKDGISWTTPDREVFNFWRIVKDKLALPLLIDLCERAGLELPPCFTRLPTDLKLKILESLPSLDIARISCVSSELRYLSSNDDLWKQKFLEQFGDNVKLDGRGNWKEKFARNWESAKKRKMASRIFRRAVHRGCIRGVVDPPRFPRLPGIIGGDYDLGPQIHPFGRVRVGNPRSLSRRLAPLPCNLGGLGNRSMV